MVKVSPFILGVLYAINTLLAYFCIETTWAGYIGHLALVPALSLISQSVVLKFCVYHRLPIYYILIDDAISTYDYLYGINISDRGFFLIDIFLIWVTLFLVVWLYVRHRKKVVRKVTS